MECKKIRGFIKTGYIDNEVSENLKSEIKKHLETCQGCRDLEKDIRVFCIEPLKNLRTREVPAYLWQNISSEIIKQELSKEGILEIFLEKAGSIFAVRRYAYASAVIVLFLIAAMVFSNFYLDGHKAVSNYLGDQAEFLVYLNDRNMKSSNGDSVDFETDIEKYFL